MMSHLTMAQALLPTVTFHMLPVFMCSPWTNTRVPPDFGPLFGVMSLREGSCKKKKKDNDDTKGKKKKETSKIKI